MMGAERLNSRTVRPDKRDASARERVMISSTTGRGTDGEFLGMGLDGHGLSLLGRVGLEFPDSAPGVIKSPGSAILARAEITRQDYDLVIVLEVKGGAVKRPTLADMAGFHWVAAGWGFGNQRKMLLPFRSVSLVFR